MSGVAPFYVPRIVETPGRTQPFAVWVGRFIYHFFRSRGEAEAYIDGNWVRWAAEQELGAR